MYEANDLRGRLRRVEQRRVGVVGLDHLPDLGSFDIEFSPSGKVLRETQYSHNGAVYDSSEFFYDEAERLIRAVRYDKDGVAVAFSDAEYVDDNRVWTTRDAAGIVIGRDVDVYEANRLLRLETYDGSGKPKRLKVFHYQANKLRSSVSEFYGINGVAERWISVYDDLDRIVETFGLTPTGEPNGDGRYIYEYDEQGRTLRILGYNDLADVDNDDDDEPNSIRGFNYQCDEHGNWIERTEYFRFSSDLDWTTRSTTRRITYYSP